jgi:FKBP-type peptidyl-prolyl cis-trans isomerase FklB
VTKSFVLFVLVFAGLCLSAYAEGDVQTSSTDSTLAAAAAASAEATASALDAAQPAPAAEAARPILIGQKARLSYAIGFSIGRDLKNNAVDITPEVLAQGITDFLNNIKPLLTEQEVSDTLNAYQSDMMAKAAEEQRKQGEKNLKEGEAWLAENAKKEGVITLASGLQYAILAEGAGETPKVSDRVTVNYSGTFIDGTEFDSSIKRGKPADFYVGRVIPGFSEALQLMKPGAKWRLFIPGKLAYGQNPPPGSGIAPNCILIFELELISIEKSNAPTQ